MYLAVCRKFFCFVFVFFFSFLLKTNIDNHTIEILISIFHHSFLLKPVFVVVRVILIVMHGWYFRCMRYRFVNGFVWVCAYDWTCVSFRWISHFYFFHLDSLQGQRILRRETVTNMLWWTIHSMVRRKQQQQQKGLSQYLVCNESDKLLKIFSPITELRASDW